MRLYDYYRSKRPRGYTDNWHFKWMCEALERGLIERKNVILELPPRHGKSEVTNHYAPAWRLNDRYDEAFMLVTNSDNLAKKFSTACRNLCSHPLEIDRDAQWKIQGVESLNYSYLAAGIHGQLTGHGASALIFDDLLKSGQEAKSDVVREGVWENVASAAINRLTPDGIVIALQARLHQQDAIGKLLELSHLKFLHLHLPAMNDDGRSAWFRDGYSGEETVFDSYAALWPERYSREWLDNIRNTVSPYYWNAQYQQVPSLGDLAYFDVAHFGVYQYPTISLCWIAVDAAQTATTSGSYTAFVCLGFNEQEGIKVLGVRRGRWRQDQMQSELIDFHDSMARFTGISPSAVVVERAAAGFGLIDNLSWRLPIIPLIPKGSKEDRAGAVCHIVNNGKVLLPQSAPWLDAFRDEVGNFPLCSYKDQTDAFVHALSLTTRPSEFQSVQLVSSQPDARERLFNLALADGDMDTVFELMAGRKWGG
jgi:predicted phage terminase large subunit-like protein